MVILHYNQSMKTPPQKKKQNCICMS